MERKFSEENFWAFFMTYWELKRWKFWKFHDENFLTKISQWKFSWPTWIFHTIFNFYNFFSLQRCKSRELKGSVLLTSCDCVKRNGLQYDCPRTECKGRPCCTVKPWPACCPSKYTWRYKHVTMGKATNPPRADCTPKSDGTCNPCVVDFDSCYNDC